MLYLITTASRQTATDGTLSRLLDSIEPQSGAVRLYLLLQQNEDSAAQNLMARYHFVRATAIEGMVSLSKARNIALGMLAQDGPSPDDLIGFPDDDAWLYPGFVDRLQAEIQAEEGWISGSYSDAEDRTNPRFPAQEAALEPELILRCLSSITFFVRWQYLQQVGGFDERLGVGTNLGSSEDIDMGLRLWRAGARGRYVCPLVMGHRVDSPSEGETQQQERPQYWSGSIAVFIKHLTILPRPHRMIAGRLRRGLYLVRNGHLSAIGFLRILLQAVALPFRTQKTQKPD
ncbi:MAG: hypothetical protein Marn2KO_36150 [Marinobacter nauticus]